MNGEKQTTQTHTIPETTVKFGQTCAIFILTRVALTVECPSSAAPSIRKVNLFR